MFHKGMYIIWPDELYIDQAVKAGIDTLLVNLNDGTPRSETERLCRKYHDQGVTVVPTVALVQPNYALEDDEQFFDGTNRIPHYYCPTSSERIDKLLSVPLHLCKSWAANAVGIDDEDYVPGMKYHENYTQYPCQCQRCKTLSVDQQRSMHADMIRQALGEIPLYHMPHINPYIWRIGSVWCNEHTYEKWGAYDRVLKNTRKMKKKTISTRNISGVWAEKFSAHRYLDRLKSIVTSPATDGYWIYSHMRFSRNSLWRTHPETPEAIETLKSLPYQSLIDEEMPAFFEELRALNRRVDKYRSGAWFWILDKLYGFFK